MIISLDTFEGLPFMVDDASPGLVIVEGRPEHRLRFDGASDDLPPDFEDKHTRRWVLNAHAGVTDTWFDFLRGDKEITDIRVCQPDPVYGTTVNVVQVVYKKRRGKPELEAWEGARVTLTLRNFKRARPKLRLIAGGERRS